MGQERAAAAIERVERALARIEAAAGNPRNTESGNNQELSELRTAYRALRSRVEGAVGQIDRVLAAAEQG